VVFCARVQVVWLVIYPHDADLAARTGDPTGIHRDLSLTSLAMHGANVLFMLLEFSLDALLVRMCIWIDMCRQIDIGIDS